MMEKVILVTDPVSVRTREFTRACIPEEIEVVFADWEPETLARELPRAQVLVSSSRGITSEMLAQAVNCRYVQKYGAGVNNIDIAAATARGIPVGSTPGTNSRSVAESALALILAVYKQIVRGHNALVQEGKWLKTVLRDKNHELTGKTVGIVGMGNIGRNLVQLLRGFDCKVYYYDTFRHSPEQEQALGIEYAEVDELMRCCDVVSLHCPLLPETHHMIDARRLALMKQEAILINCARGGVVDEAALYEALRSGQILGAGVDTFEKEPADSTHPFCTLDNIVLGPHNGGGTVEAVENVVKRAAVNMISVIEAGRIADKSILVNAAELGEKLI